MKRIAALILALLMLTLCVPVGAYETGIRGGTDDFLRFNSELAEMVKKYPAAVSGGEGAFSTARIIVGCGRLLDTSGALSYARGCGRYVIQYGSPDGARAALERFRSLSYVEYAVPDAPVVFGTGEIGAGERQQPGVDSFKSWGYGENYINAFAFNERLLEQAGSVSALPEIIVAVIDSGLANDHPFFAGRTVSGWDLADNDGDTSGGFFHGTHVAGTIVDGTLPNVKVMPLKCTDDSGAAVTSVIINCIQYAYQHGARVANVSMGGYYPETAAAYTSVINAGADAGMVTCVASGNDAMSVAFCYPACIARALTVAAHDSNFNMWSGSNYGNAVDVTAPGVDIVSAMPNGGYQAQTGTSMASPHAAAACAMLLSRDPSLGADEVMDAIKNAAVDHGLNGGGTGVLSMTALIDDGPILMGDVDGSGAVDAADALLILRFSMGIIEASALDTSAADMDGSGSVNAADALMILRKAMGLTDRT